ncbi:MAG: hypothetical protein K9G76_05665 [Bacteroidales bacterium]|nr:hypothetical protein [Bacteroidales bacterium]MCF8402484.1 hypothetical protein [Bacteroidales bacterium]
MIDEFKNIDELLKGSLEGYSVNPSARVWRNVSIKLFTTKWGIYLSVLLVALVITPVLFFTFKNLETSPSPQQSSTSTFSPMSSSYKSLPKNSSAIIKQPEEVKKSNNKQNSQTYTADLIEKSKIVNPKLSQELILTAHQNSDLIYHEPVPIFDNHFDIYPGLKRINDVTHVNSIELKTKTLLTKSWTATSAIYPRSNFINHKMKDTPYLREYQLGLGLSIIPEVLFNEGKINSSLNAEITAYYFRNDWFIQAGLGYGITEDEGVFDINYAQYDSIGYYYKVSSFTINPNTGKPEYITEEEGLFDTITYNTIEKTKNYYSYVRIPVYIGINFRTYKRISIDLKGGLVYSVLVNENQKIAQFENDNATWVNITDNTRARIHSNLQLSAGIALNYQLSNSYYLSIEPVYNHYLQSIYQHRYQLNAPSSFGIRLGLIIKL